MSVQTESSVLTQRLEASAARSEFVTSPFFESLRTQELTKEQVATYLGQWWHPLHYFPTFLARCVAVLPSIAAKSAITRILSQETGNGRVARAHEVIYRDSMSLAGFDPAQVSGAAAFAETAALVAGYERASAEKCSALGFIYATEVTDLLMVSSIGTAVERATGTTENKWVTIHVAQEPDHVNEAGKTLLEGLSSEEQDQIFEAAEEMWGLWARFFHRLSAETGIGAPR